jgi:hypothetical protein
MDNFCHRPFVILDFRILVPFLDAVLVRLIEAANAQVLKVPQLVQKGVSV